PAPASQPRQEQPTEPAHDLASEDVGRHLLEDEHSPAPGTRGHILVVDDNQMNRELLARGLHRQEHYFALAVNGRQALDVLSSGAFDVVLLDIMMPELDGFQVLQHIKADPRVRHTPVIMISALDDMAAVVRCIEMGAEDYLPKPFDPVLLQARVGACLEKKRLRDQEVRHLTELAEWNRTLERRVQEQVAQVEQLGRLKRIVSPQLTELIAAGGSAGTL